MIFVTDRKLKQKQSVTAALRKESKFVCDIHLPIDVVY